MSHSGDGAAKDSINKSSTIGNSYALSAKLSNQCDGSAIMADLLSACKEVNQHGCNTVLMLNRVAVVELKMCHLQ